MKVMLSCGSAPIGSPKPVLSYAFAIKGVPSGELAFDDEREYVDPEDIPVAIDVFAGNFHKFETLNGVVALQGGESLGDRVIDSGDVDNTVPQALSRANKVNIFENL